MNLSRPRQKFLLQQVEDRLGERKTMLTITEFAEVVGRHRYTIWEACARGDMPAVQPGKGKQYRIHFHQLNEYFPEEAAA